MGAQLPEQYNAFSKYLDKWCLRGTDERILLVNSSTMEELQPFYSDIKPQAEDIINYLDTKDINNLNNADLNLARLMFSFSVVAHQIEVYRQPTIPDTGATQLSFVEERDL